MRLIDADKMLERLQEWNTSDDMDKALYRFTYDRIMEQPTACAQTGGNKVGICRGQTAKRW